MTKYKQMWEELKERIKKRRKVKFDPNNRYGTYYGGEMDTYDIVLKDMKELEKVSK